MDKETALRKIKKCMALAKSCTPAEAEAAMRQAQALMTEFNIDSTTLAASEVSEEWVKSRATTTPPRYEVALAHFIALAFGCDLVFSKQLNKQRTAFHGGYSFIGITPSPVLAGHAFIVLYRKLIKAREQYCAEHLKRYKKNKLVAADLYCEGWVGSAVRNLPELPASVSRTQAIDAYKRVNHPDLQQGLKMTKRGDKVANKHQHLGEGVRAGRGTQVHAAMGHDEVLQLELA